MDMAQKDVTSEGLQVALKSWCNFLYYVHQKHWDKRHTVVSQGLGFGLEANEIYLYYKKKSTLQIFLTRIHTFYFSPPVPDSWKMGAIVHIFMRFLFASYV